MLRLRRKSGHGTRLLVEVCTHKGVTRRKRSAKSPRLFKGLLKESLQEVLEAEMTETVGAGLGERTAVRTGYRSGYYSRGLVTRIGKLELRVPRDREGRF